MAYKKTKYTDIGLILCLFRELRRDGLTDSAMWVFRNRHYCELDRYGWPIGLVL
jgi:hypothetical protein